MMKKTNLVLAIATASLTMAGLLMAPQADAKSKKIKPVYSGTVPTYAAPTGSRVDALESQVQSLQYELQALRAQANRGANATDVDTAKVQELDAWMNSVKAQPESTGSKENMVFFRGGYGYSDVQRGGTLPGQGVLLGVTGPTTYSTSRASQDAFYFGAGFDFKLADDLFGIMRGADVFAELMFDYKEFGKGLPNSALSTQKITPGQATVNQLSLAASPKIKFLPGQAFRPWLIPVGFELSVVSPPSASITVLNPGMQFGLGADYKVWKNLYVGADARYHYAPGRIDGINTNGVTVGGFLGIGF